MSKRDDKVKFVDKHSTFVSLLVYTIYRIVLEIAYVTSVSLTFSYMGFVTTPNITKGVLSYFVMFLLILVIPRTYSKHGQFVNLFFSICIIPMLSFYWLADKGTQYIAYCILFFLILISCFRKNIRPLVIKNGNSGQYKQIINLIFVAYVLLCLYLGITRGGIDVRAFDFATIYSMRSEYQGSGTLNGYLVNWCAKALFPTLTTYYLYKKNCVRVFICLCMQLFLYLCYGPKAYLLSIVFLLAVFFIGKHSEKNNEKNNYKLQLVFIGLLIPTLFSYMDNLFGWLGKSFRNVYAMRMLYEPARIEYGYFEFFSENNKLFFSEGLIGKLLGLKYPYDQPIGFVITRYLAGSDAVSNSNTGIIADSFSQLGIPGIILISLLMALIFRLIERLTTHVPNYFVAAVLAYPIIMLNDNPLLTNLLTNGWIIDIIMFVMIEGALRDENKVRNDQWNPVV